MTDFEFERRLIAKQDDLVTVNHGSDESTATVAHLRKTGDELHELTYQQVSKLYGSKRLTRQNLFNDRDKGLVKRDTGRGETPDWMHTVAPALPWSQDSFVYELDHLDMDMFFAREIEDEQGYEYVFNVYRSPTSGAFDVKTVAFLHILQPDESMQVPDGADTGDIRVSIRNSDPETDGQPEIDVEFALPTFTGDLFASVQEVVTGICLKHGYVGETVSFRVVHDEDGGFAKFFFEEKGFVLLADLSGNGLDTGVPRWVRVLLHDDGCPVPIHGDTDD